MLSAGSAKTKRLISGRYRPAPETRQKRASSSAPNASIPGESIDKLINLIILLHITTSLKGSINSNHLIFSNFVE